MEPVSIIGITASAFTLVDRLGKTLNFVLQLSTKFKYADAKITLLIGYLASINAAIFEIAQIVKTLSECTHYERLVDSLNTTLECTKLSLSFLESKIEGLRSDSQDEISMINRITMILKDAEFNDYINGISSYVNALNLLLNVLQSRSLLEQQGTLNSAEAQSIIEAMEDETSSIFCIADSRSITSQRSKASEFSAALDRSFQFDAEILSSRIYAVAYRSHLRQVIASKKHEETTPVTAARGSPRVRGGHTDIELLSLDRRADIETKKPASGTPRERRQEYPEQLPSVPAIKKIASDKINSNPILNGTAGNPQSQEESKKPDPKQRSSNPLYNRPATDIGGKPWSPLLEGLPHRTPQVNASKDEPLETIQPAEPEHSPQLKILLLGASDSGKSTLLKAMRLFQGNPWTAEERHSFSEIIFSNVCNGTRVVLEAMNHLKIPLDSREVEGHVQTIYMQSYYLQSMPPEVHSAIAALARDRGFQKALKQRNQYHVGDNLDFFIDSIARLSSPEYLPSDEDILRSQVLTQGVTETIFTAEKGSQGEILKLNVYDVGGRRPSRTMWIHVFKGASLVFFTVDIGSYDQVLCEDERVNRMEEALTLWGSIVNSRWFTETTFILCFTKQAKLAAKMKDSPLAAYSPDIAPSDLHDLDGATKYIKHRFLSLRQAPEKLTFTMVLPDLPTREDWEAIKYVLWEVHEKRFGKAQLRTPLLR